MKLPLPSRQLTSTLGELSALLRQPDVWAPHARLVGRKLPMIVKGLRMIGKTDRTEALSIGSLIEQNAKQRPNGTAMLYEDRRYTHRDVHELSNQWANWLASRGIGKGDVVTVLLENRPETLLVVAGVVKLGAIAAVINTKQRGRTLQHSLNVAKARLHVVGEELWDAFTEVRDAIGAPSAASVAWVREHGGASAPASALDATTEVGRAALSTPAALADVRLGDPCFYIYTSGTTGLPKASIMSHNRWTKAAGAFGMSAMALTETDVLYLALPLYHNNALTVAWASAVAGGAALAIRRKFSVSHFWEDVRKFGATAFVYIGELCRYLLNQEPRPDDRNHAVRRICGNGLRPDIWKAFKSRFGIDEVYEFYAASEGNIAFVNLLNLDCTVGLCPAPYALVAYDVDRDEPVRGPDGHMKRVGRGEVGLLIAEVSERYAFDGYTDKSASEKKLFRDVFRKGDVWFNSGDLLRDQGFRHAQFIDRVGDTFRWKGENVSTNEVAEALNTFHQVAESTVYGVQVPGGDGRCGMAALVLRCPVADFDLDAFARHVESQLPAYARPIFLRVREELEVTGTFKQVKSELRRQGFDPSLVDEPLFFMPARTSSYAALTGDQYRAISSGELRF
ncbi:MAG TPA: long-chain-acyl-CoA synthetase [Kofleriaceae bacterium]|nr:long-chain-acyl-CoA synthetase [Kofleriaceae bacterium]